MVKRVWKTVKVDFIVKTNSLVEKSNLENQTIDTSEIRKVLPTTTVANRQFEQLNKIPINGPFFLGFSNLHFDADEECIKKCFNDFELVDICFNPRKRGSGRIEFNNLEDLTSALELNGKILVGRPINLNVITDIENEMKFNSLPNKTKHFDKEDNTTSAMNADNWRIKKTVQNEENATNSDNWRIKKTVQNEENATNSDNWRIKKTVQNENIATNSDNWRVKREIPIRERDMNESNNWRVKKEHSNTVTGNTITESDNWRVKKEYPTTATNNKINESDNWRVKKNAPNTLNGKNDFANNLTKPDNWQDRKIQSNSTNKNPVVSENKTIHLSGEEWRVQKILSGKSQLKSNHKK